MPEAPSDGPISREQAVQLLMQEETPATEPAAPVEAAAEPEATEEPEAPSTGEEDAGEPVEAEASEEAETQEPEAPVVDAPHWWTAEQKARWSDISPDVQAIIAEQEGNRERATSKAKEEAALARNRAEAEAKGMGDLKSRLDALLPQAEAAFASKWPEVIDWVATAQEHGVEQTQLWKLQYEQEQQTLQRMKTAREEAEAREFQTFVQAEFAKLPEIEPDLVDPARRKSVMDFLVERGVPPEQIKSAGALEYSLAYDAMRWREAQKAAKAALAAPKPKPAPVVRAVTPAAAQPGNSQQREAQRLTNRFAQTRDRNDAVALIIAKGL